MLASLNPVTSSEEHMLFVHGDVLLLACFQKHFGAFDHFGCENPSDKSNGKTLWVASCSSWLHPPPYPACNRHHQDLTGPKAQESQPKPSNLPGLHPGGFRSQHISYYQFWWENTAAWSIHRDVASLPAFTRQCWFQPFGHQGFWLVIFFCWQFFFGWKIFVTKNLSFHVENVYKIV